MLVGTETAGGQSSVAALSAVGFGHRARATHAGPAESSAPPPSPTASMLIATTHHSFRGSFSAVSTPIFASKYSFFSIFRDLQDLHSFAPVETQFVSKISIEFCSFFRQNSTFCIKFVVFRSGFDENSSEVRKSFQNV